MSTVRTFDVLLVVKSHYYGEVEATSQEEAVGKTFHLWSNASPHPFECCDDNEMIDVVATEVRS